MIQGSELPFLSNWQNFYMIMGTAAATLTGLMFVVTTLIAGIETHVVDVECRSIRIQYTDSCAFWRCASACWNYSALPGRRSQALAFYSACWVWGWCST